VRIDDLPEGVTDIADDQLDLIVGGMINDGTEFTSLFDWDITSNGFGLSGGVGAPDGGVPTPTPGCPPGALSRPIEVYPTNAFPLCSAIVMFTSPDGGTRRDILGN
jgi:hypothetical protein